MLKKFKRIEMQDKELYHQLLGLKSPWKINDIDIDFNEMKVEILIEWPAKTKAPCPVCSQLSPVHDHREERKWRHLDTMQFKTILTTRIPRVKCSDHGVKSIEVPWAENQSRFTLLFERLAINVLLAANNQTKAQELLDLSWDEIHAVQKRAVERGLMRREELNTKYIGIDEKSFLKGHNYVTAIYDVENSRVIDVGLERKEETLSQMFSKIKINDKERILAVAMDMWKPFLNAVTKELPKADVVHDKFHIVKYLGEAVDKVRRHENAKLSKDDDDKLKGTKYLWLTNPKNWNQKQKDLYNKLKGDELKVSKAWSLGQMFNEFWSQSSIESARNLFSKWYYLATHSQLQPVITVAKMLNAHIENILTYLKHGITNAVAEGLNSKIQQVKSSARGFRNFENFRIAILFYCGKLDMFPH